MNQQNLGFMGAIPLITRNLLIINLLVFTADTLLSADGIMSKYLALHFVHSQDFMPHQLVTYMFMHGSMGHIFFNMFALFMFGRTLESIWGPKRFLSYYLITGIGAALLQLAISYVRYSSFLGDVPAEMVPDLMARIHTEGAGLIASGKNYTDSVMGGINAIVNVPMVGASGAIFGILVAFGMIFPNSELIMIPIPIPIKAKYFVIGYGALELYLGFANNPTDNVAHFAHLGGLFTGLILLLYWKSKGTLNGNFFR